MFPDDLNKWSMDMFNQASDLFKRSCKIDEQKSDTHSKEEGPNRDTTINKDDITDLKIFLGTCDSIDEFLRKV